MEQDTTDDLTDEQLLERVRRDDTSALQVLFSRHHERLRRMVQIRLNRSLWGRIDAADVLQESYLAISRNLERYLRDPQVPFFLWMRGIVGQQIVTAHRRHLGTQKRNAARDVHMNAWGTASATSAVIARQLLGKYSSPSQSVIKEETRRRVTAALEQMSELDREVLVMRHFEQMSNKEIAQALGIKSSAASNRYVRALDHLQALIRE